MDPINVVMARAAVLALTALPVAAAESWQCEAKEECSGTPVDCKPVDEVFAMAIMGQPPTLHMASYRGDLALPLTAEAGGKRVFSAKADPVTHEMTLHDDGRLDARLWETMFWGGVSDHHLTAICRRDPD